MAVIIPFADPNAHGSICDTVSFRRSRGKVVFQKKPKPKQPNTPAQQAQKQWWKDSWKEWRQLNVNQLDYLAAKAGPEDTTPANYFFDLKGTEGAYTKIPLTFIETVTAAQIDVPIMPTPRELFFQIMFSLSPPPIPGGSFGHIYDNENIYTQFLTAPPDRIFLFYFGNVTFPSVPILIPENYSITLTYTKFGGGGGTLTFKFPAWTLPGGTAQTFYADTALALYDAFPLVSPVKVNPEYWPPAE